MQRIDISVSELSRAHDMRPLVVETLLDLSELAGVIEETEPFTTSIRFTLHKPSQEILTRFDTARAEFLRGLFATAIKAEKWFFST